MTLTKINSLFLPINWRRKVYGSHIQKPVWIWVLLSFSITALCSYSKIFGSRWNSFWHSNKKLVLC